VAENIANENMRANQLSNLVCVYLGSYFGILARIGLQLSIDSLYAPAVLLDSVLHEAFFANVIGCFFLGLISSWKDSSFFAQRPYFYNFFSVGYTGSLTTFSAWMAQSALKMIVLGNVRQFFPEVER
jgi:fluoride ion exporter CrcB/FEX